MQMPNIWPLDQRSVPASGIYLQIKGI